MDVWLNSGTPNCKRQAISKTDRAFASTGVASALAGVRFDIGRPLIRCYA